MVKLSLFPSCFLDENVGEIEGKEPSDERDREDKFLTVEIPDCGDVAKIFVAVTFSVTFLETVTVGFKVV